MLLIKCPWCGPRAEVEFSYGGEAHIARPLDPNALSDAQWAEYLFMRTNPKGQSAEQWCHAHGCRQWFNVRRDTTTYEIFESYVGPAPGGTVPGTRLETTGAGGDAPEPPPDDAPLSAKR